MSLSRAGGFIAACAIHSLLFAVVPHDSAVKLSSAGSDSNRMSVSISYHAAAPKVIPQSEPVMSKPKPIEPKPVERVAKTKPKPVAKTPIQPVEPATVPVNEVAKAEPEPVPQAEVSSAGGQQGMHQTIITEPLFARQPKPPVYPNIARKRGQQGTVWVDVLLDKTGQQTHVEIFQSSGVSPLDRAALKAVKQWQFIAHQVNDMTVASHIRIPVEFSLD